MAEQTLTPEQAEAVFLFAVCHGRNWKSMLSNIYWYNARLWRGPDGNDEVIGSVLHGLRNSHGPSWLADYKLPKEE